MGSGNILLINQYYPPDTAATAKAAQMVAEALAQRYQVTVLAGRPSYNPIERHPWYLFHRVVQGKVVTLRVGSTAYPRHRMPGRLANYLSYLALAIQRALTVKADVILSMTDPPVAGIAGALVARLRRRPFVYCIQDLHPDMALASGLVRHGPVVLMWEKLHRWVFRRAALITVLGVDMRERIIAKGVDPGKVEVVRHGAVIQENIPSPDHPVLREISCGFSFAAVHAGNLGFYGPWETLIRAAELLKPEKVGFIFVGDGAAEPMIRSLASSCDRVRVLPFRPLEEVPYVLAAGDVQVVAVRRGLEGMVVPSKLYPILAAGRPVLAVVPANSEVARIVTQNGCGVLADPDDPFSVASAVSSLIGNRARLREMSRRARTIAKEYESEKQLKRFVQLIEKMSEK